MTPREAIKLLFERMNHEIIGQEKIVERFIMGMLADGNLLVEGLPGLAKTKTVRAMADAIEAKFSRIQFTPDLEPSDVVGEERLYIENGKRVFKFHEGPIFGNIILADEINRAPAKVQSAMLEAMEEKQVTVAGVTYELPQLFMVLATQNPLEQKGTYPLPEAQKDRFLMHVKIEYVSMASEYKMVTQILSQGHQKTVYKEKIPQTLIFTAREEIGKIHISEEIGKYIIELVFATRYPLRYSKQLGVMIDTGVSPRGSLALTKCARVHAWMRGRLEVTAEDVREVIHDVFRHRILKSEHTKFSGIETDEIIDIVIAQVPDSTAKKRVESNTDNTKDSRDE